MKALIIYYSFEGNTKLISESIASVTNADILELKPKKDIKTKGFMKYVWGGKSAMMKEAPELEPFDINIDEYDLIFLGTPVWAWTYAPALNSFFKTYSINNKNIALFCCHGGGKGKIFTKFRETLPNNNIVGEIDFKDPLKHKTEDDITKAKSWAKDITNNLIERI